MRGRRSANRGRDIVESGDCGKDCNSVDIGGGRRESRSRLGGCKNNILIVVDRELKIRLLSPMFRDDRVVETGYVPDVVEFVNCRRCIVVGDEVNCSFAASVKRRLADAMNRDGLLKFSIRLKEGWVAPHMFCAGGVENPVFSGGCRFAGANCVDVMVLRM